MKNSKTLKRCFDLCKGHGRTIILITIFAIILDAIALLKPYLIKLIIDNFLSLNIYRKGFYTVTSIGVFYLLICLAENTIDFISATMTNVMGERVLFELRNRLFKFTQNANITFHDQIPAGTIFVRIINDVDDISSLFKEVIATIFKDLLSIVTTVMIMIYFSYKLSMYAFIVIPFVIISALIFTKALNYIYTKSNNIRTKLNTFLAESIYGAKLIKIFNIQKEMKDDCYDMSDKFYKSRFPSAIFEALFPGFMILFENIAISIIVFTVLKGWIGESVQVGFIYIFITYIRNLFEPITRVIDNVEIIQEAGVSINKIYDILDKQESQEDLSKGEELKYVKGKLEFKNVWFKYKKSTHWILQDVSFTIEPGETIALVGRTGSR